METSLLEGPVLFLESEPEQNRHTRILLVEDHRDTARILSRLLENAGYEISHAETVAQARDLAAGRRFDLVISDLGLPDGSGLELMQHLRDTQNLSGIALSGFGSDDDVAASTAVGFAEHVTKPVDWERLRSAIERLVPPQASAARSAA
jgi:DNA-binding response OmpR family regulator